VVLVSPALSIGTRGNRHGSQDCYTSQVYDTIDTFDTVCHYYVDMQTLTVIIPDHVHNLVSVEAAKRNVNAAALCSGIIAEHFLDQSGESIIRDDGADSLPKPALRGESSDPFDVRGQFPGYPKLSVELAQGVVNEALRMPNTRASKADGVNGSTGIAFTPNFVFIQYLQKREPGGIMVSFYGPPHRHGPGMKRGQGNYSRIKILSGEKLTAILPEIRLAYKLKFK
jgi:hypothetical protein